ncbi:ThiF family adenylyltransferase [Variovorax atrisoli]|uniref:ThiF family adenylyltransferase n=1 Tax=Variovorax atrisoli TaxID=3394203 RepID=UPI000475B079|nr:ThiF family adenylyltransferase [Variovorax paradoxus]
MSHSLISRSPDLKKLRDEGYEIEVRAGHLLVHSVPYVNSRGETMVGTLVSSLILSGDITARPDTHVVHFIGEHPCNLNGTQIVQIKNASNVTALTNDIVIHHSFSNKPLDGYRDYHHKMTRYIEVIGAPARSRDPAVTAQTFRPVAAWPDESVFRYVDTASSRAGIQAIAMRLAHRIAIIGLGGTGSYLLDLLAKTPATEIHLFDGDVFMQHNAFRAPGAPSLAELEKRTSKVDHFTAIYSNMHAHIVAHNGYLDEKNLHQLQDFDIVFICVDRGSVRRMITEALVATGRSFIDVGMGVELTSETRELLAVCRVTAVTAARHDHIASRVSMADRDEEDAYGQNIQIADLNALNAVLAVIKWKKMCGFYADEEGEHHSTYSTSMNLLTSDEVST